MLELTPKMDCKAKKKARLLKLFEFQLFRRWTIGPVKNIGDIKSRVIKCIFEVVVSNKIWRPNSNIVIINRP